jgi:hypothetical protein
MRNTVYDIHALITRTLLYKLRNRYKTRGVDFKFIRLHVTTKHLEFIGEDWQELPLKRVDLAYNFITAEVGKVSLKNV